MHSKIVNIDLHIPAKNITYLPDGEVYIVKEMRGEYYSVTHWDLEKAKDILLNRLKGNIPMGGKNKSVRRISLQDLTQK